MDGGLRQIFRQKIHADWCSIESGTTGGGIPDSNYCLKGIEGWIEYKLTMGHTVPLRPEQIGWITRRVRNGGRVHIAVRQLAAAGPRRDARDALWLIPGADAATARIDGLTNARWPVWHGGPGQWDWPAITQHLTAAS